MRDQARELVRPTPSQAAWADAEIGVIIHYDLQVFEPTYEFRKRWGYTPDPGIFNPKELDTDQWIAAAKSAGATYAVLVAKHCSGFSLWPTKAHSYSVASTPWRGGKGDIVGDFIQSCRKFGLKPGLYASASCNAYLRVDNPGKVLIDDPEFLKTYSTSMDMQSRVGRPGGGLWAGPEAQKRYNQVVETQLTELWTNYGKLFELWFDGGVLPPEQGGPDIVPIMRRLQPEAVVRTSKGWLEIWRGTCVGHKRLERFEPIQASELRLRILESVAEPLIREFSAWEAAPELFGAPLDMTRRCQISLGCHKEGMVNIRCSNPNLYIRYTLDGTEPSAASPLYTKPFPFRQGGEVKAYAYVNDTSRTATASAAFGVDRGSWKIVSVSLDSPFPNAGHAGVAHLLNDAPEYYWHTYHTDKSKSAPPHEVVLDMGREVNVAAFTMLPRSGAGVAPDRCEFHLSPDGRDWKLAAAAEFTDLKVHDRPRLVKLDRPMAGRFLRFVATHALDNADYVVVAGIGAVEVET